MSYHVRATLEPRGFTIDSLQRITRTTALATLWSWRGGSRSMSQAFRCSTICSSRNAGARSWTRTRAKRSMQQHPSDGLPHGLPLGPGPAIPDRPAWRIHGLMLLPDSRTTACELLRPPGGYRLDFAVLTAYTLDLEALLVLPLSMLLDVGRGGACRGVQIQLLRPGSSARARRTRSGCRGSPGTPDATPGTTPAPGTPVRTPQRRCAASTRVGCSGTRHRSHTATATPSGGRAKAHSTYRVARSAISTAL